MNTYTLLGSNDFWITSLVLWGVTLSTLMLGSTHCRWFSKQRWRRGQTLKIRCASSSAPGPGQTSRRGCLRFKSWSGTPCWCGKRWCWVEKNYYYLPNQLLPWHWCNKLDPRRCTGRHTNAHTYKYSQTLTPHLQTLKPHSQTLTHTHTHSAHHTQALLKVKTESARRREDPEDGGDPLMAMLLCLQVVMRISFAPYFKQYKQNENEAEITLMNR